MCIRPFDNRAATRVSTNHSNVQTSNTCFNNFSRDSSLSKSGPLLIAISIMLWFHPLLIAQQPQLSKEYTYLGDRLSATSSGNGDPILIADGIGGWWSGDGNATGLVGSSNCAASGVGYHNGKDDDALFVIS